MSRTIPTTRSARPIVFRVLAVVISLPLVVITAHLLVTGWFDGSNGGARRFDDIAWGAIEGVIVLGALLTQLRRPDRHPVGMRQSATGFVALIAGGAATGAFDPATVLVAALVALLVWLHPARAQVLRLPSRPGGAALAAAATVTPPLLAWAGFAAHTAHSVAASNLHAAHQDYAGITALAIGLTVTAWLAACDHRPKLPGISFGVALTLVGVASLVLSDQADALPASAAVAAIAVGIAFPLLTRGRPSGRHPGGAPVGYTP